MTTTTPTIDFDTIKARQRDTWASGDYAVIGGQVGIGEKARIEDQAAIGGQAGILPGKVVRKGSTVWGTPARPLAEFKKIFAHLSGLPGLARKVEKLSRQAGGRSA